MERRNPTQAVAATITSVMDDRGVTAMTLSEATDISFPVLRERLNATSEFTYDEVAAVGGFFRLPTSYFFEGVAA